MLISKIFACLGLFSILNLAFLSLNTSAHVTGFAHHETNIGLVDGYPVIEYSMNLFFKDFEEFYQKIDTDNSKTLSEIETDKWLKDLTSKIYIKTQNKTFYPNQILNISSFEDIKNEAYPIFSFHLAFRDLKIANQKTSFETHNSLRFESVEEEEWTISFDPMITATNVALQTKTTLAGDWEMAEKQNASADSLWGTLSKNQPIWTVLFLFWELLCHG
jgi:hypothetical protein